MFKSLVQLKGLTLRVSLLDLCGEAKNSCFKQNTKPSFGWLVTKLLVFQWS